MDCQCGRRIMVITAASQAAHASSILVARSKSIGAGPFRVGVFLCGCARAFAYDHKKACFSQCLRFNIPHISSGIQKRCSIVGPCQVGEEGDGSSTSSWMVRTSLGR